MSHSDQDQSKRTFIKKLIVMSQPKSSEDEFLAELIKGKTKWTNRAKELADKKIFNENELSYAEAYKILINKFTNPDTPQQ